MCEPHAPYYTVAPIPSDMMGAFSPSSVTCTCRVKEKRQKKKKNLKKTWKNQHLLSCSPNRNVLWGDKSQCLATAGSVIGGTSSEPTKVAGRVVSKGEARGWWDDLLGMFIFFGDFIFVLFRCYQHRLVRLASQPGKHRRRIEGTGRGWAESGCGLRRVGDVWDVSVSARVFFLWVVVDSTTLACAVILRR